MTTFFDLMRHIVNTLNAVVRIDSQDLSNDEKTMARNNIDAAGQVELVEITTQFNNTKADVDDTKEQLKNIKEEIINEIKELPVKTTDVVEADNTLPITSAGVYTTVGNIEVLLNTI